MLSNLPRTIEMVEEERMVCVLLDQRKLPHEVAYIRTTDWREVVDAIKTLAVRGAPAIGVAGAAAVALAAQEYAEGEGGISAAHAEGERAACEPGDGLRAAGASAEAEVGEFWPPLGAAVADIVAARPTAVNLAWAANRAYEEARALMREGASPRDIVTCLFAVVDEIAREDEAANRAMGGCGAALLPEDATVLTHCNAGSLATSFYGTALGVIYAAAEQGKVKRVYADETRPVGQGARLTAWELAQAGVPVTLICDNMAASVMAAGKIDAVIVGADRITANGDVANKIGTYGVAVLARHHGIPFYVAAPSSTIDLSLETGAQIPIEQRAPSEVLPRPIEGVDVFNPAFDVTPARLITKIITERGVFSPDELKDAYNN